jgi:pimeloyl-ACP methyl ester carboxylesterase
MRKIVCPILSIYVDPTRTIRTGEAIPSPSKSVCFEGCGHWIHQERPAEINWVIDTWLAGLPE